MEFLYILAGILFILFGYWMIQNPTKANKMHDRYRIKGKREYSDLAQGQMVMTGLVLILFGIIIIVAQVVLLVI